MRKANIQRAFFSTAAATFAALLSTSAHAALTISDKATQNVSCSGGVCAATAKQAVLNVTDLANLIASSSVTIQSGSQAQDIVFDAPFSWTSSNGLTLESYRSITVNKAISDAGPAALTLTTNDGGMKGDLRFGDAGKIGFLAVSNVLTINGQVYTLVPSVSALANAVTANPYASLALANDYDAAPDGTYATAPVQGTFYGEFEGLGNSIANLSIDDSTDTTVGLFAAVRKINGKHPYPGTLRDLSLASAHISSHTERAYVAALVAGISGRLNAIRVSGKIGSTGLYSTVGGVAGYGHGSIQQCHSNAQIRVAKNSNRGGLVGYFSGKMSSSSAAGSIAGGKSSSVGGLVGTAINGSITTSFSSTAVTTSSNANSGGLIGESRVTVENSYALGPVSGGAFSNSGGLIGTNYGGPVVLSYSAGAISGSVGSFVGGFVGDDTSNGEIRADYWDTDASGQSQGAGNLDEGGMIGLTTQELQSGLPAGFKKSVWAQNARINNGYPYLIDNPPTK